MADTTAFLEAYTIPDKYFVNLEKKEKKSHRETSQVDREDGAKHRPFLLPKMISKSGIYVPGRCHEEVQCS